MTKSESEYRRRIMLDAGAADVLQLAASHWSPGRSLGGAVRGGLSKPPEAAKCPALPKVCEHHAECSFLGRRVGLPDVSTGAARQWRQQYVVALQVEVNHIGGVDSLHHQSHPCHLLEHFESDTLPYVSQDFTLHRVESLGSRALHTWAAEAMHGAIRTCRNTHMCHE